MENGCLGPELPAAVRVRGPAAEEGRNRLRPRHPRIQACGNAAPGNDCKAALSSSGGARIRANPNYHVHEDLRPKEQINLLQTARYGRNHLTSRGSRQFRSTLRSDPPIAALEISIATSAASAG